MEIQQSSHYASFIRSLGWVVEKIEGSYIYIKPFPVIGGLAKIQRVTTLPAIQTLIPILKHYRVRTLAIEPDSCITQKDFNAWCQHVSQYIRLNRDPFLPTKTIRVDLTASEQDIFRRLTEAKRRAVRRAEKNRICVINTDNIQTFIQLKNRSAGLLGFITTTGVIKLWNALPHIQRTVLLAREQCDSFSFSPIGKNEKNIVGGILLLFWNRIAYYWVAGATREGKKLFAPTLLVWEAIRESRKRGCRSLDFVGVWDERRPKLNHEWLGFTKFKEGFGGESLYYPLTL